MDKSVLRSCFRKEICIGLPWCEKHQRRPTFMNVAACWHLDSTWALIGIIKCVGSENGHNGLTRDLKTSTRNDTPEHSHAHALYQVYLLRFRTEIPTPVLPPSLSLLLIFSFCHIRFAAIYHPIVLGLSVSPKVCLSVRLPTCATV